MDLAVIISLVIFATVLLLIEVVLIPGFGITGITGLLAMLGSVLYAFMQLGSAAGWITLLVVCMICISFFLWALYGNSLDRVALKKNIGSKVNEVDVNSFHVGERGIAKTRLALIGEANIGGRIVEVKSEEGFINEKEEIEVVRISSDSIFVVKVKK